VAIEQVSQSRSGPQQLDCRTSTTLICVTVRFSQPRT